MKIGMEIEETIMLLVNTCDYFITEDSTIYEINLFLDKQKHQLYFAIMYFKNPTKYYLINLDNFEQYLLNGLTIYKSIVFSYFNWKPGTFTIVKDVDFWSIVYLDNLGLLYSVEKR